MDQKLDALVERLLQARNHDDLDVAIRQIRDFFDVEHVIYHSANQTEDPTLVLTYDQQWVERYLEQDYTRIDPVVQGCFQSFSPVNWKQLDWSGKRARNFLGEAVSAGVGNQGLSVPIRGPNGQFSLFTVTGSGTDDKWEKFAKDNLSSLLLLSHYVNQRIMDFSEKSKPQVTKQLSPREMDTLTHLAVGCSRGQAAENLGISEHTLRVYIESARLKLGAANTTHAVAIALTRGIIIP